MHLEPQSTPTQDELTPPKLNAMQKLLLCLYILKNCNSLQTVCFLASLIMIFDFMRFQVAILTEFFVTLGTFEWFLSTVG